MPEPAAGGAVDSLGAVRIGLTAPADISTLPTTTFLFIGSHHRIGAPAISDVQCLACDPGDLGRIHSGGDVSGNPFAEPGDKLTDHQVIATRRLEAAAGQLVSARKPEVRTISSGSTGKSAREPTVSAGGREIDPLVTGAKFQGNS